MHDATPEPIRHLVVLGHPAPPSFNHLVAETYCEAVRGCGQEAVVRDLYAIGFDPLLKAGEMPGAPSPAPEAPVLAEHALLRDAAIVTLVYPIWFGLPPAIIKGYVDRVLGIGFDTHLLGEGRAQPVLSGKRLMQFSSSATTLPWLEEKGQWVTLRRAFGAYLATVFGITETEHVHFDAIVDGLSARVVEEHLAVVHDKARSVCAAMLSEHHAGQFDHADAPAQG